MGGAPAAAVREYYGERSSHRGRGWGLRGGEGISGGSRGYSATRGSSAAQGEAACELYLSTRRVQLPCSTL